MSLISILAPKLMNKLSLGAFEIYDMKLKLFIGKLLRVLSETLFSIWRRSFWIEHLWNIVIWQFDCLLWTEYDE